MTKPFRPLLAEPCDDITVITYPVLASPKFDGIRCVKRDGKALTRKLKPIPNEHVRKWVESTMPDNIDGELMLRDHRIPLRKVSSAIMGRKGEPDFVFHAFDLLEEAQDPAGALLVDEPFELRYAMLQSWKANLDSPHFQVVPQVLVESPSELLAVVDAHLDLGYEGTMVRDPRGIYKFGRSTLKEGILLKIKPFADEEAKVIGAFEAMHNTNEKVQDERGYAKRSRRQAGMVPAGKLGGFVCETLTDGVQFEVSAGFTDEERDDLWKRWNNGELDTVELKFKHQPPPGGRQPGQVPRGPAVFLCLRED